MEAQRQFIKFIVILSAVVLTVFLLEFVGEWLLLGRPDYNLLSLTGEKAPKPADFLSPTARAYNNILAMVLATVALAIPLTANMYTAKLIDMFLRDRVNQFMLLFWAIMAGHAIWVLYLSSPGFTPTWMIRLTVLGAIFGWIALVPYFFYIVRFLDPTHILARIRDEAIAAIDQGETGDVAATQAMLNERLHQIGTIILKTIDRGERGVTLEGIRCMQQILSHYGAHKARLPAAWFTPAHEMFIGLSTDALAILHEEKTWLEHRVLFHISLAYQGALAKTQDVISSLSEATREIALAADERGDEKALELAVKFFNNFFREAIKRRDLHAIHDLTYQYRALADALWQRPALLKKIGGYFRFYSDLADLNGLTFVPQIVAVDLSWIVRMAYEHQCDAAPALLANLLSLKHWPDRLLSVKAKLILGGVFIERNLTEEAALVRANLADVPRDRLTAIGEELLTLQERTYWEVTDRQVMFEWVPHEKRGFLKTFIESCL